MIAGNNHQISLMITGYSYKKRKNSVDLDFL